LHPTKKGELSSAGSEHLPYKQRVTGSNPVAPTENKRVSEMELFFLFMKFLLELISVVSEHPAL
jgi:hypothetical protein